MSQTAAARTTRVLRRPIAMGLVVAAAIIGTLAQQSASSSASSFNEAPARGAPAGLPRPASPSAPSFGGDRGGAPTGDSGAVTEDDGALPDGVTVFDDEHSGVVGLDPDLLRALRDAGADAADDGIKLYVNSGWRSPAYQDRLLHEAVSEYGSAARAARWVATSDTSPHVSGEAVDIGTVNATEWLSNHGAAYGLCQIYRNEPWHYELRPKAIDRGCPRMYVDPTHDPRLQP